MRGVIRGHGTKTVYLIDGEEVTKEAFFEAFPPVEAGPNPGQALTGWKPLVSLALGVHPRQRQAAIDDSIAKGVPTEFNKRGRPIFRTRQHRKAYSEAYGFFDNDAGYSDAAGGTTKRDVPDRPDFAKQLFDG
jgi:hypothetical protein